MPNATRRLTARLVASLKPEDADYVTWDETVKGLGVRTWPSGRKVYVLKYRPTGSRGSRYLTLGAHPALTADEAARLAKKHLGAIADGGDPASRRRATREAPTVAELGEDYLAHVEARRQPATARKYRDQWTAYVLPALGSRKVASVTLADVSRIHRALSDRPVTANRVAALLSAFFAFAGRQGVRQMHDNPVRGLERYSETAKERFLTDAEFVRLGEALRKAERDGLPAPEHLKRQRGGKHRPKSADAPVPADPFAVAALRLLALTGARVGEVLTLKWADVDLERGFLRLGHTKTGASVRPLGGAALALLGALPRVTGNPYVFPNEWTGSHLGSVKRFWASVRAAANLADVRLHDLRHSHASVAASAGQPLLVIGKLLGHKQSVTTARYAHLGDDPMKRAADDTSATIARALAGAPATPVTPIKRGA